MRTQYLMLEMHGRDLNEVMDAWDRAEREGWVFLRITESPGSMMHVFYRR